MTAGDDIDVAEQLTVAISAHDGSFRLTDVPAGMDFPLVIQIGKWRRVVMVSAVDPCTTRELTPDDTRLPRNSSEGYILRFAVTTGAAVDGLECVLHKMGTSEVSVSGAMFGFRSPRSSLHASLC